MRAWLGILCAFAAALVAASAAHAKTYEVTRTGDPVPGACKPRDCSLREAVLAANQSLGVADRIVLPNRRRDYRLTQPGTGEDEALDGDLDVANDRLAIVHPGKGRATIDASGAGERALHGFSPLTLRKLALTGGEDDDGGALRASANTVIAKSLLHANLSTNVGGAIDMNDSATLRITDSVLRRNEALNTSGAIRDGGGAVTILRSRFIRNEAASEGGAIRLSSSPGTIVRSAFIGNRSGAVGGAIQTDVEGPFVLRKSTLQGNQAAGEGGGLYANGTERVTIVGSTLSANRTATEGGGAFFDGPPAAISNSTFAGNRADSTGGGIHAQDGADLALNAVTVARNRAAADDAGIILIAGGGIYRLASAGFDVANSLIGLNTIGASGTLRNDCAGSAFDSLGGNVVSYEPSNAGCGGFDHPTDEVTSNPRLGKLKANGGPTKTVALKRGSAAIGNARKASAPNRDQRGRKRDRRPDTGAYERGA